MASPRGMTPLPSVLHLIFILRRGALVRNAFCSERFGAVRMAHHLLVEQRAKQHMLDKACRTCEVSHPAPLLSQPVPAVQTEEGKRNTEDRRRRERIL